MYLLLFHVAYSNQNFISIFSDLCHVKVLFSNMFYSQAESVQKVNFFRKLGPKIWPNSRILLQPKNIYLYPVSTKREKDSNAVLCEIKTLLSY